MKNACIFIAATLLLTACAASRKNTKPASAPTTGTVMPPVRARAANGVYSPGDAELQAIRATERGVTMETLTEGYRLYTGTACTKCHGTKSITSRPAEAWPGIISNMAGRARLSDPEKDAVLKYVLSIKAAQGK